MIISVEGIDYSGKSTLCSDLTLYLNSKPSHKAVSFSYTHPHLLYQEKYFPEIAELDEWKAYNCLVPYIRNVLKDTYFINRVKSQAPDTIQLLYQSISILAINLIKKLSALGYYVILHRSWHSAIAYSEDALIDPKALKRFCKSFWPQFDKSIFLVLQKKELVSRKRTRVKDPNQVLLETYEQDLDHLLTIQSRYLNLVYNDEACYVINSVGTPQEVLEVVLKELEL